jgi:repressor LexA
MIIKDLIKSSGFKQKWIAEQLGVSEITISNWVSGKYIP